MARVTMVALAVGVLAAGWAGAEEVARPETARLELPPEWKGVPADVRLAAKRVAELDATAKLVERVYGMQLSGESRVLDFVLESDLIRGELERFIRGVRDVDVRYTGDLTVEVVRRVTVRQVVETLTETIRRHKLAGTVREEVLRNVDRKTLDTVLAVLGNGAVPDSKGHTMVMAKRAAEMDAMRKLAVMIAGTRVFRTTEVRKLMLENDRIAAEVGATVKGAKTTRIVYQDDGSCAVTMDLKLREVIETLTRSVERYVKDGRVVEKVKKEAREEHRDKVLTVVGEGAPRHETPETVAPASDAETPFYQEVNIIRRVIRTEVGVLD